MQVDHKKRVFAVTTLTGKRTEIRVVAIPVQGFFTYNKSPTLHRRPLGIVLL